MWRIRVPSNYFWERVLGWQIPSWPSLTTNLFFDLGQINFSKFFAIKNIIFVSNLIVYQVLLDWSCQLCYSGYFLSKVIRVKSGQNHIRTQLTPLIPVFPTVLSDCFYFPLSLFPPFWSVLRSAKLTQWPSVKPFAWRSPTPVTLAKWTHTPGWLWSLAPLLAKLDWRFFVCIVGEPWNNSRKAWEGGLHFSVSWTLSCIA